MQDEQQPGQVNPSDAPQRPSHHTRTRSRSRSRKDPADSDEGETTADTSTHHDDEPGASSDDDVRPVRVRQFRRTSSLSVSNRNNTDDPRHNNTTTATATREPRASVKGEPGSAAHRRTGSEIARGEAALTISTAADMLSPVAEHASPATASDGQSSNPGAPVVGVLEIGDDEKYNEQMFGPGRMRNKGSKGIGADVIGEDLEELDPEQLRAIYAFKSPTMAAAQQQVFEYSITELSQRLGSRLKLLAAGFDESVMHLPHRRPLNTSLHAYRLGPGAFGDEDLMPDDDTATAPGTVRRPSAASIASPSAAASAASASAVSPLVEDESLHFGSEYRAVTEPFTEQQILLAKAASQRRRRDIKRQLWWLEVAKQEKARERAAARAKEAEAMINEASQSSYRRKSSARKMSLHSHTGHLSATSGGSVSAPASAHSGPRRPVLGQRFSMAAAAAATPSHPSAAMQSRQSTRASFAGIAAQYVNGPGR